MNMVEPIRDKNIIRDILNYLKTHNERDYILMLTGILTGLRISDLLLLRVEDVKGKKALNIRDKKTKKINRLEFTDQLYKALRDFTEDRDPEEYLFKSRSRENKPISRGQCYRILRDAAKAFNIDNIGTHTLRKTFGYHLYMLTKDIVQVQTALNHSSPTLTLRYIGIQRDTVNKSIKKLIF